MELDRTSGLPFNATAEAALLGALIANNRAYDRVSDILRAAFFAVPVYGQIYAAIAQGIDAGRHVDAITLRSQFGDMLTDNGDGTETPIAQVVVQCLTAMVGIINVAEYGRAIVDAWHRRQLIDVGSDMVTQARAAALDAAEDGTPIAAVDVHEAMEGRLFAVSEALTDAGELTDASGAIVLAIAGAEAASKRRGGLVGVTSGLHALDDLTGGFRKGQLIILGARPSMGKTACSLAMADGASNAGITTLFVSLEMASVQLGARLVSGLSGLPGEYADRGQRRDRDELGRFVYHDLEQGDWDAMVAVQRRTSDTRRYPLHIDECKQRTMATVRSRARTLKRKHGLGLIVIDYLGLMRVPELSRVGNRVLEVSRISADAKALALEIDVPVVLLSQLNRGVEGRDDRRPRLSDLRDSGSLEQDADIVMFLHREHYYLKKEPIKRRTGESDDKLCDRQAAWTTAVQANYGRAQILIDKQRMGPTGAVEVAFNETNGWISDLSTQGEY